jgi:two-component SAPR family response regulator
MPNMNGADLARKRSVCGPGLKILFISCHPERAGAGLDPLVTNLLMKPFTADTWRAHQGNDHGRKEVDGWGS